MGFILATRYRLLDTGMLKAEAARVDFAIHASELPAINSSMRVFWASVIIFVGDFGSEHCHHNITYSMVHCS